MGNIFNVKSGGFRLLHAVVQNKVIADILNLFLPLYGHGFNGVDAYIELVPDKQYQGVDIDDDHQHNDGAY